jgi:hypothetical protein
MLLLAAGCATNQTTGTAHSEPDMLIASGFVVCTPDSTQQAKLQSLTAGQISQIQTRGLTLYVYPDWPIDGCWSAVPCSIRRTSNIVYPSIYPLKMRRRFTVVHHHSTGASGITRVESMRAKYL